MNPKTAESVIRFVSVASALSKRAMTELQGWKNVAKRAADATPALVTRMLESGSIKPGEKQAVENMLQSHPETLNLLNNAITKIAELKGELHKQASAIGGGVREEGRSTYDPMSSLSGGVVGLRTSNKKASDIAFAARLGLATA